VPVEGRITGVPPAIQQKFSKGVTVAIDIMFVNKIAFLITVSRDLHFGTVEVLTNRQVSAVSNALK
jgi:hypothetical protein